ncbi:MAG TPA: hypothetical protein PLB18_22675, partial [Acidobacteriota bacterium]|nr:hypothetical protein [Acidobacteriota bacterium]
GSGVSPMFEIRQPALESPSQLTASKTEQRVSLRWMPVSTETESTELIKPAGFGEGAIFPQLDLAATSRDGAKAVLFGEVLTPKSYPATLKKVYYLSAGSLFDRGDGVFRKSAVGARFQMRIFNLPPNGDLDQLWLNPREYEITIHKEPSDRLSVREPDDFNHYDISEYTIDQGNFYVSFQFVDKGTSQISERGDDFPFVIKSRGPVSGFGSTHGDGGYLVTTDQFVANKPSDFPILGEVAYGTPKPAITGYRIYRSTTTPVAIKPENLLAEINAGTSSFQDELPPESIGSYFYAVTARSGDRESNASNEAKITLSDFQLSITPTTQTLAAGQMTTAQLTVEAINGFSQPVMLSAAVEPAGSGLTVQPSSTLATPGTTIPILLGAGSASQPGSYTVTLTGTVGTLARSITLNLTVVVPDFSIGFVPESLTISRGGKGQFQLQITRMGGLTGPIKMTFPDTKALKLKLSPSNPTISGTTFDITFKSKKSSPAGTYPLVFTGTDETGRTRTTILSVAIQ